MPRNHDPFAPWNGINRDNPFLPHNGIDANNPFKPWNTPFGSADDLDDEERRAYGLRSRRRYPEDDQ